MNKKKKLSDNIGKLSIQLDDLYKSDPTLDYLKHFEEDRKALLGVQDLYSAWSEPTIQEKLEDMRKALGYPELQEAFKSYNDYTSLINPINTALQNNNPYSILEALAIDPAPYLDSTYAQTLKATGLFSETLANVSQLNLPKVPDYIEQMGKIMSLYQDNIPTANKSLIELATSFEHDAFKSRFEVSDSLAKITKSMSPTLPALDSVNTIASQAVKLTEAFSPIKSPWLDSLAETHERIHKITEPVLKIQKSFEMPMIKEHVLEIPHYEPPRPEDSPHYKQNEKILNNSEEQIVLLNQMSVYMSSQTEKLEFLNDITVKQVEENKLTADKQMKEDKAAAEKGMAINAKSSRNATWIAIAGIFLTLVVSVISIWATLYVYELQDISDNQDQAEVVQLLKANNLNGSISELVNQLKKQNQNTQDIQLLKNENEKMKLLLEAKQTLNKDLD